MQVVFTQTVKDLCQTDEIREVKTGYARNYLIPQGLAVPLTKQLLVQIEARNAERTKAREELIANAASYAKELGDLTVTFTRKTTSKDKLYGSVDADDVIKEIVARAKVELDASQLVDFTPLKEVGIFPVTIKITDDVSAEVKVEIKSEK